MNPLEFLDRLMQIGDSTSSNTTSGLLSVLLIIVVSIISLQTVIDVCVKIKLGMKRLISSHSDDNNPTAPKTNDIRARLFIDEAVENVLGELVTRDDIDRAILFQFHNGVVMKSGMPFEYVVITHEAVSPGVAPSTLNGKHHDMRVFSELINKIIDGKICNELTKSFSDPLSTIFHDNGDLRICVKIITDILTPDTTLGFIMYSTTKNTMFPEDIDDSVLQASDKIAGILSNIWGRCDFCKNQKTCKKKKLISSTLTRCKNMIPMEKSTIVKHHRK